MRNREIKLCTEFGIVSVSIFTLDENALISYINKKALQLINKKQEEVIGKHFGDSFNCTSSYKDKRGCGYGPLCLDCEIRKAISLAFESGQITDGLELNKQLLIDGKESDFWFKISVTPIMAEAKKNVVVSLSNITQKKKEELSILRSGDYFNNILNQIPAIVWKLNADLECEYVNMEWERFTGIKIEEALGNGLIQVLHPDDLDVCSRVIFEARKKESHFKLKFDYSVMTANFGIAWFLVLLITI